MNPPLSMQNRSGQNAWGELNRRQFLDGTLGVTACASTWATLSSLAAEDRPLESKPVEPQRKIKLGVVGNGERGAWIAKLFQSHGGYTIHAVADYFQEVADRCGDDSHIARNNPHGDSHDVLAVSFSFADGIVWDHCVKTPQSPGRSCNFCVSPWMAGAWMAGA
jgi:hypothetical protein